MGSSKPGSKILILCDFDGTVSTKDTVNRLISEHTADPEWRRYSDLYVKGEIGSKQVYEAVGPMMKMTRADLDKFVLEHAALDPAFPTFLKWTRDRGIDVKIVSDGFDATIETLFRNHDVQGLEIFANSLVMGAEGKVKLGSPHADPECGKCGTCKLRILRDHREHYDRILMVGDGTSDHHAAEAADSVAALGDLFLYCVQNGIPATRVEGFHELPSLLVRRIEAVIYDMDGTLIDSTDSLTESFNHMFTTFGRPTMTSEEVIRKTGMSLVDFVKANFEPEQGVHAVKVFRDYYNQTFLDRSSVMPHVGATLSAIDGRMAQGVVTNKRGSYARRLAEHFGISTHMSRIIGAQDGFKSKPAGDMLRAFMDTVGTAEDATVYVGDSPIDIESAANAGIDCFVVAGGVYPVEEIASHSPRRVLSGLQDLPNAVLPLI